MKIIHFGDVHVLVEQYTLAIRVKIEVKEID
jgi:hypothetical protein